MILIILVGVFGGLGKAGGFIDLAAKDKVHADFFRIFLLAALAKITECRRNGNFFETDLVDDDFLQFIEDLVIVGTLNDTDFFFFAFGNFLTDQRSDHFPGGGGIAAIADSSETDTSGLREMLIDTADIIDRGLVIRIQNDHFFKFSPCFIPLFGIVKNLSLTKQDPLDPEFLFSRFGFFDLVFELDTAFHQRITFDDLLHFFFAGRINLDRLPAFINGKIVIILVGGFHGILIIALRPVKIGIGDFGSTFIAEVFESLRRRGNLQDLICDLFGGEIFVDRHVIILFHLELNAFCDKLINLLLAFLIRCPLIEDLFFLDRSQGRFNFFLLAESGQRAQKKQNRKHVKGKAAYRSAANLQFFDRFVIHNQHSNLGYLSLNSKRPCLRASRTGRPFPFISRAVTKTIKFTFSEA